ncbi:MAG: leucine-rich repeat protein, partial [Bacteroidaceae bacterium]|nr:leucine-rich repeat protein [Bacteroidaceae bacterium]
AFSGCTKLKTVWISDGLGYIGSMAFNGCKNLESVYCYSTKEIKTYKDAFDGCVNATLYGLDDWMTKYSETDGWNKIASKVSLMPITIACGNGGSMQVNGMSFEETIGKAYASKDGETTISFTLAKGQQLSMVKLNGEDITNEVQDNVLTTSIPADATLLVTFKNQVYDINQDGEVTISDVVSLVNYILSVE